MEGAPRSGRAPTQPVSGRAVPTSSLTQGWIGLAFWPPQRYRRPADAVRPGRVRPRRGPKLTARQYGSVKDRAISVACCWCPVQASACTMLPRAGCHQLVTERATASACAAMAAASRRWSVPPSIHRISVRAPALSRGKEIELAKARARGNWPSAAQTAGNVRGIPQLRRPRSSRRRARPNATTRSRDFWATTRSRAVRASAIPAASPPVRSSIRSWRATSRAAADHPGEVGVSGIGQQLVIVRQQVLRGVRRPPAVTVGVGPGVQ